MSEKYNDGVLDEKFSSLHEKIETYAEAQMRVLSRIEDQTTRTNGRVTAMEKWRSFITGFVYAVGVFMTVIILPLLGSTMYEIYVVIPKQEAKQTNITSQQMQAASYAGVQQAIRDAKN